MSGTPATQYPLRPGFDPALAGKPAECDGGVPVAGGAGGTREEYAGVLTGEYVDHGDPPWRWFRLAGLSRKPDGYPWDSVWCESGNLFVAEEAR